jgi:predicted MFS family arabinose efflux permease
VYMMCVHGGIVVGAGVGGVIAHVWGVTGPFWFAFVGSALILSLIWTQLANIAHTGDGHR